jgi:UrcA family protein
MNRDTSFRSAGGAKSAAVGAAAALLLGATLVAAAHASPDGGAPSVVVRYDARSAATDQGALELYRRLVLAAGQVCPADSVPGAAAARLIRQCRADALARAVSQVPERRLVEIAAARAGRG